MQELMTLSRKEVISYIFVETIIFLIHCNYLQVQRI